MRRNHFTRIKARNWWKFLLKAEKEHQNRKSLFRQIRIICVGICMQVSGNHLKNNQTQNKWLRCKTWWGISQSLRCRLWFNSYTVLYLSLEVLVDPQNYTFEKIRSKVLTLLKISEVPAKERCIYLLKSSLSTNNLFYLRLHSKLYKNSWNAAKCKIPHFTSK